MIWILIADMANCHIYTFNKKENVLELVKEIKHPEDRLKTNELISDQAGHYQTSHYARGTYSPHLSPKEVEVEKFIKQIAHELNQGRINKAYTKLYLFMGPHLNGLLQANLDPNVLPLIKDNVTKDIIKLPNNELLEYVKKYVI